MKKLIITLIGAMALSVAASSPVLAYRGGHGGWHGGGWHGGWHGGGWYGHGGRVGVGVVIGPGWDPWWGGYYPYYPYYPYSYPYYAPPPVVIEKEPDTYIQQTPQSEEPPKYWYYCKDPKGYYPYVKKCPKGWMKVVPPTTPEDEEE